MNLTRRRFLELGALALSSSLCCSTASRRSKPNIIFILADDLGYGDLGCYGQTRIRTPNLDRMAAEGIRFTDFYAGSTVCAPSRCSLMTGLHCGHARIRGNSRQPLLPEDVTAAEWLKKAGYRTGLIGKWGLGESGSSGHPNLKGFDFFYGYLNQIHAHNYYPGYLWRNSEREALEGNVVERVTEGYAKGIGGMAREKKHYSHDLFTAEALRFVRDSRNAPFFLYLAYTAPHANNEARHFGVHGMEVPDYGPYATESWPDAQKGHAAMITRMDRDIGSLLGLLNELGLDRDTVVFFSSDNGPHKEGGVDPEFNDSNAALRGIKRDLYEGGIRVPLIARWPGRFEAGRVSDRAAAFWDMLPTFADLAGAGSADSIDGISLLPELLAEGAAGSEGGEKAERALYWEFHERDSTVQAVRRGAWKGIRFSPDSPLELYDLKADLGESDNIASQHPDVVRRLEDDLESERTPSEQWPLRR